MIPRWSIGLVGDLFLDGALRRGAVPGANFLCIDGMRDAAFRPSRLPLLQIFWLCPMGLYPPVGETHEQ